MGDRYDYDLLRASYEICNFLLHERDLPNMLQGICDRLAGKTIYDSVLIVLLDEKMGGMITAETGLEDVLPSIMEKLREGSLPHCGLRLLETDTLSTVACESEGCEVCSSMGKDPAGGVCTVVRCTPTLYGFLVLYESGEWKTRAEDIVLLEQVADAVSQALRRLFSDEETKHREEEMRKVEERYELALYASQAGLWDWNIQTGEMYTSPNQKEYLDYRNGDAGPGGIERYIHPDDREKVLTILNEHLAGKNDEYRIEYRVKGENDEWIWYLDRGKVVERDEKNMPVRMTGTHQNITLQKQREHAVAAIRQQLHEAVDHERTFLQTVIDSAGDPVMAIDLDYTILLINRTAVALIGGATKIETIQGQKCYRVFCGTDTPCSDSNYPCPIKDMVADTVQKKMIHNPYHGNGINNTFELDVSPLFDKQGNLYGIIEIARDVTDRLRIEKELRDSQSRLYRLAHHDTLTGLPNRLLFRDRLHQAIIKAKRNGGSVAVMYLDLDRFKLVNDNLGHDVGDALLIESANRLQRQCRMSDTVARLGGDEFVFVLDGINSRKDVAVIADKILVSMRQPIQALGHSIEISTSIGIALYPDDSGDIDEAVKCADLALYESKERGRNTFRFYRPEVHSGGSPRQIEENDLYLALVKDQLFVRYQPIWDLSDGAVVGLDTCLGWTHPVRGEIAPDDFLPIARQAGLVKDIYLWILQEVCSTLQSLHKEFPAVVIPVTVEMDQELNSDSAWLQIIADTCAQYDVSTEMVEQKLVEKVVMGDQYDVPGIAEKALELGIPLVLSGFGSGHLSPSLLQQMALRRVVLPVAMLEKAQTDPDSLCLIEALIALAHSLGVMVTGDGVHNGHQEEMLRQCGCDLAQGRYFSEPIDREQVLQLDQIKKIGAL